MTAEKKVKYLTVASVITYSLFGAALIAHNMKPKFSAEKGVNNDIVIKYGKNEYSYSLKTTDSMLAMRNGAFTYYNDTVLTPKLKGYSLYVAPSDNAVLIQLLKDGKIYSSKTINK